MYWKINITDRNQIKDRVWIEDYEYEEKNMDMKRRNTD